MRGFRGRHARLFELLLFPGAMELHPLGELRIDAASVEEIVETAEEFDHLGSSVSPQRHNWIHPCRATSREPACDERDGQQHHCNADERDRIGRAHLK
jgi:hypothetical protein